MIHAYYIVAIFAVYWLGWFTRGRLNEFVSFQAGEAWGRQLERMERHRSRSCPAHGAAPARELPHAHAQNLAMIATRAISTVGPARTTTTRDGGCPYV